MAHTTGNTPQPLDEASSKVILSRNESLAKAEIGVQSFIFLLAVLGNCSVLFVLKFRKLKTSKMHLFIAHLSIADLMVAFFNILPQLAWDITLRFRGSDSLCRFIKFMQVAVIYASTYILVMTAIDRYIAICRPMHRYIWTRQKAHSMAFLAWGFSLLLSTPQLTIFQLQSIGPNSSTYDCWATFSPDWTLQLYATFFSVTVYIVPSIILAVLYGRICYVVWRNLLTRHQSMPMNQYCNTNQKVTYKFNGTGQISIIPEHSNEKHCQCNIPLDKDICETKLKTIKLTFVVIIAYVVCWSPFMVTQLWWAYDSDAPANEPLFVLCLLLASLNSCCNPLIYMAFSSNFVHKVIPCLSRRSVSKGRHQHCPQCVHHHHNSNNAKRESKAKENDSQEHLPRDGNPSDTGRRDREEVTTRTSLTKTTNRLVQQESLRSQPVLDQIEESPQEQPIVSRGNTVLWDYNPLKDRIKTTSKGAKNSSMKSCKSLPHVGHKHSKELGAKCTSV